MENTLKKSDFVLKPYMKSNDWKATYQVLNTLVPYLLLWFLAYKAAQISFLLLPPIIILLVLFSLRSFSLMHDCGHYSLFRSKRVNRIVGFIFGLVNAMPQYWWAKDHDFHHKTNGDWERYRGIGDFLSTEEFDNLTPLKQKMYAIFTHPWIIFPGGFFYLAFKPRLILITGGIDFIKHIVSCLKKDKSMTIKEIIYSHDSIYWFSEAEFWDVLFNSIFVVAGWIWCCQAMGTFFFLSVYSIVLTLAAAFFVAIFFVQHNFEGAYANTTEGWDYLTGAIEGSSFLEMPAILRWFTADISYHNIHHLSARIPNYNLKACHYKNAHLLNQSSTLYLSDIGDCAKYVLWDNVNNKLVSIASHTQKQPNYNLSAQGIKT